MSQKISVIIPTYNRSLLLERTLASFAHIAKSDNNFEIVVSDDGSSDDTFEVVKSYSSKLELRYVYAPDEGFQAARARNLGASISRGEIFVFCDSGNVVCPQFISLHRQAHAGEVDNYVIGPAFGILHKDYFPVGLDERLARPFDMEEFDQICNDLKLVDPRNRVFAACEGDLNRLPAPWAIAWTVNVSVTAQVWKRGFFFDENFKSWGCEDDDFALSLWKAGVKFRYCSGAAVIHSPHERAVTLVETNDNNKRYLHQKHQLKETLTYIGTSSIVLNVGPPGQT